MVPSRGLVVRVRDSRSLVNKLPWRIELCCKVKQSVLHCWLFILKYIKNVLLRSSKVSIMGRQSPKMKLRLNLCASTKLGPNGLHTSCQIRQASGCVTERAERWTWTPILLVDDIILLVLATLSMVLSWYTSFSKDIDNARKNLCRLTCFGHRVIVWRRAGNRVGVHAYVAIIHWAYC